MEEIKTKYGILKGISSIDYYKNGNVKECMLNSINKLESSYGILIPKYEDSGERSKHITSVSFYNNGNLKSISLQNQIEISTPLGILPAEFITFYESGSIKRLFPLNGKLTAYWTEKEEYNLAKEIELNLSVGKIKQKIIGIHFYENGVIKSVTFWPKDNIIINSPLGSASMRIGISFYPDGKLKSFEPNEVTAVKTQIGTILAYDTNAVGIHGDLNSLKFSEGGKIESLITSTDIIEVIDKNKEKKIYGPLLKQSIINENAMDIIPLIIEFSNNKVRFNNNDENEYNINECNFTIKSSSFKINSPCSDCTNCSKCNGGV